MPIDNAQYISQLSRTIPDDATSPFYWADSMRTIKQVVKNTFPNWIKDTGITDFNKLKLNFENIKATREGLTTGVYFTPMNYKGMSPTIEDKKYLSVYFQGPISASDAQIARLSSTAPLPPIGSLVESALTDAQMTSLYPTNTFVLCDGRSIYGSYYWFIKGSPLTINAPDLRTGQFLRPAKTEALIGTVGLQGTIVDALTVNIEDNSHTFTVSHQANVNHYHTYTNAGLNSQTTDNGGGSPSVMDYNDTNQVTASSNAITPWDHTAAQHAFAMTSANPQTLPNFMIVNVFMRIN